MKMRWIMIVKKHLDDNPVKTAYFRHILSFFICLFFSGSIHFDLLVNIAYPAKKR
jgi:hypothetical protein